MIFSVELFIVLFKHILSFESVGKVPGFGRLSHGTIISSYVICDVCCLCFTLMTLTLECEDKKGTVSYRPEYIGAVLNYNIPTNCLWTESRGVSNKSCRVVPFL